MPEPTLAPPGMIDSIVAALGADPIFTPGAHVRISTRSPVGHYRVPLYLRGKAAIIESVCEPAGINNEEEGYGLNAGIKRHYYRVAVPMTEIWPGYAGPPQDGLRIEIYETWLEEIAP